MAFFSMFPLRFNRANAIRATVWLCISGIAFLLLLSSWHEDPLPSRQFPRWMWPWAPPILAFLIAWTPGVAVGAFFGHTKRGMVVGLVIIFVLVLMNLPRVKS